MSTTLEVTGGRPLTGRVRVPGDKSISHRALLLGALAAGRSRICGLSDGDDVARTAAAVRALGATVDGEIVSGGAEAFVPPSGPLDVGNSGTTMRLVAGVVAGYDWDVELIGDDSLSSRPMDRVAGPLRAMGASIEGVGERCLPPLRVHGAALTGIDYTPPMASAQVKSCVLLAGLRASGETVVREPVATRLHTEELLARCGAHLGESEEDGVHVVRLRASALDPLELDVPGDPSQAAFWVVAASIVPGSDVVVEAVYGGPGRRGYLDVLRRMGASVLEVPAGGPASMAHVVDLHVRSAALSATEVAASEITGLDEVPVLAVAAALAQGTTVFHDVGELRVKESDRLAGSVELVRAFGGTAEAVGDDLVVDGVGALCPGRLDARGDHRMAMAAAVAGLGAGEGGTRVTGWQSVASSYPAFDAHLRALVGLGDSGRAP
ncbi:MAG: 3-phosphoshikimate 1-carboxyvinyltransferase [Acidimicrobiales bacterium]